MRSLSLFGWPPMFVMVSAYLGSLLSTWDDEI
jgi:hypothetical protein